MVGWIESISQIRRPYLGEDVPVLVFRAFRIFTGMFLRLTPSYTTKAPSRLT